MWRIHDLKLPFIYFYLFGQTSFIPLKGNHFNKLLVISFLPKSIYFLVLSSTIYLNITQNHKWPNAFNYSAILALAIITFSCTSGCLTLFTNLTLPTRSICNIIAGVIQYTELRCSITIPIHQFQRNCHREILFGIFAEFISGSARTMHLSSTITIFKPVANFFVSFLLVYKVIMVLHIKFFIALIGLVLHSVNIKLKNVSRTHSRRYSVASTLQRVKWIHYNLWKISKIIYSSFGWILVFLLLENCVHASSSIYWIFIYTKDWEKKHIIQLIRKYIFLNLSFFCY